MADHIAGSLSCDFYSGTAAYRAKRYPQAAGYWERVIAFSKPTAEDAPLQSFAYNNLGYLSFFGFGVTVDQPKAIRYWLQAMKSGDAEPAYHLCHAYAKPEQSSYNRKLALTYCPLALQRYQVISDKTVSDIDIMGQIQDYIKSIK
jgi:TPR repeat protein